MASPQHIPTMAYTSADQSITPVCAVDTSDMDGELVAIYENYLAAYKERLAKTREQQSDSGDDSDHDLAPDDEFPDYMWSMQDYMEFILVQRDCAANRERQGLPPADCDRGSPCDTCRLHDGSYVPSTYWHLLADKDVEAHLRAYQRIREELPAWQSARPANLAPPTLFFGQIPAAAQVTTNSGGNFAVSQELSVAVSPAVADAIAANDGDNASQPVSGSAPAQLPPASGQLGDSPLAGPLFRTRAELISVFVHMLYDTPRPSAELLARMEVFASARRARAQDEDEDVEDDVPALLDVSDSSPEVTDNEDGGDNDRARPNEELLARLEAFDAALCARVQDADDDAPALLDVSDPSPEVTHNEDDGDSDRVIDDTA